MTRTETSIWAVGRISSETGEALWPSTVAERESGALHVARWLATFGITSGDSVMLVSLMSEGIQVVPIEDAIRRHGAVVVPMDATAADARRVLSFVEMFPIRAVLGITGATLDGFDALGHSPHALAEVPLLLARPGAYERLENAGLAPFRWITLGPTVALECQERSGVHFDGTAWEVSTIAGEIVLRSRTGLAPDEAGARNGGWVRTGIDGTTSSESCLCGSEDPRVLPNFVSGG